MAYTRQIINVGTTADDGSGDYLRDALVKVNTNFENLWTQSAVDSNIDLTGNTISTVISNLDIKLDPNGSGKIVVTSDIEPDTDSQHDIGSSTKKFNNIHTEKFSTESGVFGGQSSAPSNPVTGQVYFNTTADKLQVYDSVGWKNLATSSVSGSFIELINLSVTQNSASGSGTLSYNNSNGVFTYTPPDLSSYITSVAFADVTSKPTTLSGYGITDGISLTALSVGSEASASGDGGIAYNNSTGVFTYTPPDLSGYTTASSTTAFTNKSGNISQWTNDLGYITASAGWNVADDTSTVKQIRINDDLKIAGGTGITTSISGDTLTITSSSALLDGSTNITGTIEPNLDNAYDLGSSSKKFNQVFATSFEGQATGNTTASSSETFTNKSGNISQWTNDSGYLTSVPAQSFASLTGKPTTIAGYGITDGVSASSTNTLTNKTIDANGTGNSITNLEVADFTAASIVTSAEGLNSSYVDTSIPTTKATKNYIDDRERWYNISANSGTISGPATSTDTLTIAGHYNNKIDTVVQGNTVRIRYKSDEYKVGTSGSPHSSGQIDWDMSNYDMLNVDFDSGAIVIQLQNAYTGRFHGIVTNRDSGSLNVSVIDDSSTVLFNPFTLDSGQTIAFDITCYSTRTTIVGAVLT